MNVNAVKLFKNNHTETINHVKVAAYIAVVYANQVSLMGESQAQALSLSRLGFYIYLLGVRVSARKPTVIVRVLFGVLGRFFSPSSSSSSILLLLRIDCLQKTHTCKLRT